MRRLKISVLFIAAAAVHASAANLPADSAAWNGDVPTVKEPAIASRDFPFLMALLQPGPVREALALDPDLEAMARARWAAAASAAANCDNSAACEGKALLFTPDQIAEASQALRRIYENSVAVRAFVQARLNPIEEFRLNPSLHGEALLLDNWTRSAAAIDLIIARYCENQPPRYKDIDAGLYPQDSPSYGRLVEITLEGLSIPTPGWLTGGHQAPLFFLPSLRFSIRMLEANSLDQAGRFWPLRTGPNAAALAHLPAIHWANYPYSVIVVPGAGSELPDVPLSPWGKERLRLAADAFRSGAAPLLLVSGGFVHPPHTRFCEAIEMKRYLEQALGIPASAILVDPYARHTTTNLRNAAREVLNYGIPANRSMLIVSDAHQIDYIQSKAFAARCQQELRYLPVMLGKRLSPMRLEAMPSRMSLFRDPLDPLDP